MKKNYYIIGRKTTKYGLILYCVEMRNGQTDKDINLDDIYIQTFYYKGHNDIKSGDTCEFSTIKAENGVYCFE